MDRIEKLRWGRPGYSDFDELGHCSAAKFATTGILLNEQKRRHHSPFHTLQDGFVMREGQQHQVHTYSAV